jgi:hypothetical protein
MDEVTFETFMRRFVSSVQVRARTCVVFAVSHWSVASSLQSAFDETIRSQYWLTLADIVKEVSVRSSLSDGDRRITRVVRGRRARHAWRRGWRALLRWRFSKSLHHLNSMHVRVLRACAWVDVVCIDDGGVALLQVLPTSLELLPATAAGRQLSLRRRCWSAVST